ncbi:Hsp33 family molecular chaperone HslO [Arhodomonas sp. SL1]|uniref:Hsp33 family molecular chaperone HslO n=1 Tax=Arhodomonas sp. SL1 TaxID=3425691 RepID=UPI003F883A64
MSDRLYRFLFDGADVRGELVQLDATFRELTRRGDYPPVVARLLGEGMAAAALLTATLKFSGRLVMQIQANGPLTVLVVQASSDGGLRAMARYNAEVPDAPLDQQAREGALAITVEPEDDSHRYQGIVDLAPGSLAAALEKYFRESEQLDTRVWLSAVEGRAGGMLLQRIPGGSDDDPDAWERSGHLAETLTARELLHLDVADILHRLFHEEDVRLFDPLPLRFQCRCSRENVGAMIAALGPAEVRDIVAEQGGVEVHCDFCNQRYYFDAVDAEQLLADPSAGPPSATQH